MSRNIRRYLPSPHSELLLGTTLGVNDLKLASRFNDILVSTGTIHVVVVSGYNISLVFSRLISLFKFSNKKTGYIFAQVIAVIYALITGFDPPVVRALIMVSVVLWAKSYGRNTQALRVFTITVLIMLLINPLYLLDISFQLSVLATLGLVLLTPPLEKLLRSQFGSSVFVLDFSASLSAQILVLPLISYYFGRINIISALINGLVLWLIPPLTIFGMVVLLAIYLPTFFASFVTFLYFLLSSLFINIISFIGERFSTEYLFKMDIKILTLYYTLLFLGIYIVNRKKISYA